MDIMKILLTTEPSRRCNGFSLSGTLHSTLCTIEWCATTFSSYVVDISLYDREKWQLISSNVNADVNTFVETLKKYRKSWTDSGSQQADMVAGRRRGKSIVQETAMDISFIEDSLDIDDLESIKLQRSRSLDIYNKPTRTKPNKTFPLTESEKDILWKDYIESYDYDLIIPQDQLAVLYNIDNEKFLQFDDTTQKQSRVCTDLLQKTTSIIKSLDNLASRYENVLKETSEFQANSTSLMEENLRLSELGDAIDINLKYFESLDYIQRVLNTPGSNLVKKQSFRNALYRLDECLDFCHQNPEFKEVETYSIRFRQCMTRSLTLIRNYLINYLKTLFTEVDSKLNKQKIDSITNEAFLFNEFSSKGERFKELVLEINKRIDAHNEYSGLLFDILNNFFKIRYTLLNSLIWKHIDETTLQKKGLVQFAQDNISFFIKMCTREYEIFDAFFLNDSFIEVEQLENWFKTLSEPFADTFRNKIIRETDIEALCQFSSLFQKYYEFDDDSFSVTGDSESSKINFGSLFQPIVQDIQTRLIFRVQVYIDENIVKYKPTPQDLKIGGRRQKHIKDSSELPNPSTENNDNDRLDKDYNSNLFKDWYPPLGKAISVLSAIYQLVNSVVFDDLAHYIVHVSIECLKTAYALACTHLGKLDAELYMMQHLILLRTQIQTFDIQYVRRETTFDFSGIAGIFEIIKQGSFSSGNFMNLARESVPKVVNNMVDAKYEVQSELRNIVHQFTEDAVNKIIEPLRNNDSSTATSDNLKFRENIEVQLTRMNEQMHTFIQDDQVINFLLEGIQDLILQTYEKYYERLFASSYHKGEIQDIMEVDALIGFLSSITSSFNIINPQELKNLSISDDEYDVSD